MARILLVEDSPTQAFVTSRMLEGIGHRVMIAGNGRQGIEYAKKHTPDLIIMDVIMPDANGYQATRTLSNDPQTSHIPIVILSSKDQVTDKLWGLRQGAMSYLTKPVEEKELVETVTHLLDSQAGAIA
jgi:twitching motility two-component system response regulator PilH